MLVFLIASLLEHWWLIECDLFALGKFKDAPASESSSDWFDDGVSIF